MSLLLYRWLKFIAYCAVFWAIWNERERERARNTRNNEKLNPNRLLAAAAAFVPAYLCALIIENYENDFRLNSNHIKAETSLVFFIPFGVCRSKKIHNAKCNETQRKKNNQPQQQQQKDWNKNKNEKKRKCSGAKESTTNINLICFMSLLFHHS